ncbi:hypothetical protein GCM10009744_52840 [Kribbella alba]|uniref:Uncharacterized protein n=1 Tax=Kribbella alba TaxID=190197 RepID=A0ABN2FMQ8_9ACTN
MKLYLSSFRLGDHPERLVDLLPASPRVAVIANSIDNEDPELRGEKVAAELTGLTDLGLRADELDLRDYSGDSAGSGGPGDSAVSAGSGDELRARLRQYDGVWVRGGNVFVLRVTSIRRGIRRRSCWTRSSTCTTGPAWPSCRCVTVRPLSSTGPLANSSSECARDGTGTFLRDRSLLAVRSAAVG